MTYAELLEWVETNAERFNDLGDMLAGINGYNRLPDWVKTEITDIWETFHAIAEEEDMPEEYEDEESDNMLFGRIRDFINRVIYGEYEEYEE